MKQLLPALFLLLSSAPLHAGPAALDLIPADATAAIAVPNLKKLQEKGDKLVADSGAAVPRISQLFNDLLNEIGVTAGLDSEQCAALIAAPRDPKKENIDYADFLLLVLAVPFTDRDQIAGNFGFKPGELKPGDWKKGRLDKQGLDDCWFHIHGNHLFMSMSDESIRAVVKAKPLRSELDAARQRQVDQADLVIHVAIKLIQKQWNSFLSEQAGKIESSDPAEKQMLEEFVRAAQSFRYLLATARLDDGLAFSTTVAMAPEARPTARKLAALLGSNTGQAGLRHLPEGNVIAAQALVNDGSKSAFLARSILEFVCDRSIPVKEVFTAVDRLNYVNVFTEIWQRLRGSRVAMYQTPSEFQLGLFSFVAILDTEDPAKLLADLKELAQLADARFLEEQPADKKQALINKLIRDLGHADFEVRHSASTRLALLGEPVIPYLEKALKSDDLEIALRADRLRTELVAALEERRQRILAGQLPKLASPSFAFLPALEQRGDHAVQIIRVKLQEQDAPVMPQLKHMLGPDWDKIRLATHGKHVVALLGSDVSLLDTTLKNLKDDRPGLAGNPSLAAFQRFVDPKRSLELHASAQRALALLNPEAAKEKIGPGMTSFALTVDADYLRLDIWLPTAEFGALAPKQ